MPVSPDAVRNATMMLGLQVHGVGLSWSPTEVGKLPWSSIQYYAGEVSALWDKLNKK